MGSGNSRYQAVQDLRTGISGSNEIIIKSALNVSWTAPGGMPGAWKGSPGA